MVLAVLGIGYGAAEMWLDGCRVGLPGRAGQAISVVVGAVRRAAVSQPPQGAAADDDGAAARAAIEREMRDIYRMAAGHPESLAAELDSADELWLNAVARKLWPHREYDYVTGEGDP